MYNQIAHSMGQRQKTIGTNVYNIVLMDALPGMVLAKKLVSVVTPAITALFDKNKQDEFILPEEDLGLTEVAFVLAAQLDKLDIAELAVQLLKGLECNGSQVDINSHFRGNYSDLMTLCEFALKENFSDFFTKYLKDKGLAIPTLREFLKPTLEREETQS